MLDWFLMSLSILSTLKYIYNYLFCEITSYLKKGNLKIKVTSLFLDLRQYYHIWNCEAIFLILKKIKN